MRAFGFIFVLATVFSFAGCSTRPAGDAVIADHPWAPTIGANPRFADELLRVFYDDDQWRTVSRREYDAYVTFDAYVNADRTLQLRGVREVYPDLAMASLARSFAGHARLSPITVGTRIPPPARVHVIFYNLGGPTRLALVFAEQTLGAVAAERHGGALYLSTFRF